MTKTPHEYAEELLFLGEEYSRYSGELAKLTQIEAEHYKANRGRFKSDAAVEKEFLTSQDGIHFTNIKLKLKAIEKKISSIKAYLEVTANEARGLY